MKTSYFNIADAVSRRCIEYGVKEEGILPMMISSGEISFCRANHRPRFDMESMHSSDNIYGTED